MGIFEDLDLDSEDLQEALILCLVLVALVVTVSLVCCHLRRRAEKRRERKRRLEEEAGPFFSFPQLLPHSVPAEPGPLAALVTRYSSVFTLSGNKMHPDVHPTAPSHPPEQDSPGYEPGGQSSLLLATAGQHVPTPIHPPSYFSTPYSLSPPPPTTPPTLPPPYRK